MEVLTLGAGWEMRKVLFRGDEVLGGEGRSSKRQPLPLLPALQDCLLIPGTPHYTPDQHIIAMFGGLNCLQVSLSPAKACPEMRDYTHLTVTGQLRVIRYVAGYLDLCPGLLLASTQSHLLLFSNHSLGK